MAIIRNADRPALRLVGEGLEPSKQWSPKSAELGNVLSATRAVARIEIEGGVFPWAGTAFVVAPRLALTASYVGDACAASSEVWLNFADNPADEPPRRIRVSAVEKVHPYWRFSYLRLGEDAPCEPLMLAGQDGQGDLTGRKIVAIGYSSFDQRNEEDVQNRIFGKVFDVKRISPGIAEGFDSETHDRAMLRHDASTLGGSGGAPVIDVASGEVLGIHYSGIYKSKNLAVCAWDARGDPQWEHLWTGRRSAETVPPPEPKPPAQTQQFFDYAQLKAIKAWLGEARINDESSLKTIFLGLSPEFMGQVPAADLIIDRLELALDFLNDRRKVWGGHPPLYYVLTNARERRQLDPAALIEMDRYLAQLGSKP